MTGDDVSLCFVRGCWAWFSPRPPTEVWADDFDDAPYEHNAGDPDGAIRVAWDGPFLPPCDPYLNSPWSAADVNAGAVPWLTAASWAPDGTPDLPAGTPLSRFRAILVAAGGGVWMPDREETA